MTAQAEPATRYAQIFEDIQHSFRAFVLSAATVSDEEIDKALRTVEHADSVGAILDPTAYRNALETGTLNRQRKTLLLFRRTLKDVAELWPDVERFRDGPTT